MFEMSGYFPFFLSRWPEVTELERFKQRQQNFEDFGKNFFFLLRDIYLKSLVKFSNVKIFFWLIFGMFI